MRLKPNHSFLQLLSDRRRITMSYSSIALLVVMCWKRRMLHNSKAKQFIIECVETSKMSSLAAQTAKCRFQADDFLQLLKENVMQKKGEKAAHFSCLSAPSACLSMIRFKPVKYWKNTTTCELICSFYFE